MSQQIQPHPIAEIVTFRVRDDVSPEDFLVATEATRAFLDAAPGFVARHLSRGADGTWTDHVIWTGLAEAQAASDALMARRELAPFLAAIRPDSVVMRHDPILFQME